MNELTDIKYWQEKQKYLKPINLNKSEKPEWLNVLLQYLKGYEGGSFIEIGCTPGYVSALICKHIKLIPFGIDYSPMSHLYLETMRKNGIYNATLFNCDIRDFKTNNKFDIVGSVGLIEHFKNPFYILLKHYYLAKVGGIIFCVVPNFRYFQWLYHFCFDRTDLSFHNLKAMNLNVFSDFSNKMGLRILFLGYCGRLYLWGVDQRGPKYIVYIRSFLSKILREISNKMLSKVLPPNSKYYSPWLVYIAVKEHENK